MKSVLLSGLVVLLSFCACVKSEEFPTESTYTFNNATGTHINFDVYQSKTDYANNTNKLNSYSIQPGASQRMVLKVGQKYWIDWYSDNYSLNNWASSASNPTSTPFPELQVAAIDDQRTISAPYNDTARSIILNNNGTSSTWKGAMFNTGNWDGMHEFTFRKDFIYDHVYTDLSGNVSRRTMQYQLSNTTISGGAAVGFIMQTISEQSNSIFRFNCNLALLNPITGRDTLVFSTIFSSVNTGYLVRQR